MRVLLTEENDRKAAGTILSVCPLRFLYEVNTHGKIRSLNRSGILMPVTHHSFSPRTARKSYWQPHSR